MSGRGAGDLGQQVSWIVWTDLASEQVNSAARCVHEVVIPVEFGLLNFEWTTKRFGDGLPEADRAWPSFLMSRRIATEQPNML